MQARSASAIFWICSRHCGSFKAAAAQAAGQSMVGDVEFLALERFAIDVYQLPIKRSQNCFVQRQLLDLILKAPQEAF
jgi:hypothetical protein